MTTTLLPPPGRTDAPGAPPRPGGTPETSAPTHPRPVTPRRLAWQHGAGKDLIADSGRLVLEAPPAQTLPLDALADLAARPTGPDRLEGLAWAAATAYALRAGVLPTRWDDWSGHNAHRPFPSPRAKQAHAIEVRTPHGGFTFDEVRGTLSPMGPGGRPAVIVRSRPDRIPEGYGRMRIALSLLEIGHIVGELAHWLAACGRRPAYAVHQDAAGAVAVVLTHTGRQGSEQIADTTRLPDRPRRCSGLDVRGLSPDPRPLAADAFATLLGGAPVSDITLRHRLALRGITGTPGGVADTTATGLRRVCEDNAHEAIARAVRGPRGVVDVARMNILWGIASPLPERLHDPDDYPRLLVRVGAAAQGVCRAAASAGLFARPLRGIDEPDVEAALRLPAGEDLLYLVLVGKPRVHGFTYDLSPAPPPAPSSPPMGPTIAAPTPHPDGGHPTRPTPDAISSVGPAPSGPSASSPRPGSSVRKSRSPQP